MKKQNRGINLILVIASLGKDHRYPLLSGVLTKFMTRKKKKVNFQ